MANNISVGLGEMVISKDPNDILVAYGLGSCLGIGMVDPLRGLSGLLHAVLPERSNSSDQNFSKYVDSGMQGMLEELVKSGADRNRIVLRIAGGANMLTSVDLSRTFDIGTRNIKSAQQTIPKLNLKLSAQDVGGTNGRTVRLYVRDGRMTVRMIGGQERDL
ncbi:MAG: chemotaxis protein CheD [Chloroflexi bacterium]|nr:chemotaxis protein CheD [Anaerolineaceae bacterium]NMB90536.1 chemotaxis protein CheD [Chloroflexota bacterium]